MRRYIIFIIITFWGCSCQQDSNEFPVWKEGEMEIHHIYTGRGESNFLIFPDGTTMLIDAGDYDPKDYPKMAELLPDTSQHAGTWIARYVKRMNPHKDKVDYLMISHFHSDHIGDVENETICTKGRSPDYMLTGIAEVGEYIRFGKVFDRGFPDYQYPLPIDDQNVNNYRAFLQWQAEKYGLCQEVFKVGKLNQIHLLNDSSRYQGVFSVRNLAANGEVWTGIDEETVKCYGFTPLNLDESQQNENTKSLAIRVDYGPFSYYTGGDLSSYVYDEQGNELDVETLVGKACGEVDVCKANHHAWTDAMSEGFIRNIRAKQYVIPVWEDEHIQPVVMERMLDKNLYSSERMIFPTNLPEHLRELYANRKWMAQVCPEDGHVVIKVFDKGKKYAVYILSAKDEENRVKAVYGPFDSKSSLLQSSFDRKDSADVKVAIIPEHADYDYRLGEEVCFLIEVSQGGQWVKNYRVDYELGSECFPTIVKQDVLLENGKLAVKAVMNKAGFMRCKVKVKRGGDVVCESMATVAVGKEKIVPVVKEPEDFEEFWDAAIAESRKIELSPHLIQVPELCSATHQVYRVDFQNDALASRFYGILTVPKAEGCFPAILQLPGAGVHRFDRGANYGDRIITLDIGIHGIPQNLAPEVYEGLANAGLRNYSVMGNTNRDTYYYKRVYVGCVKAIDFLFTLPWFDKETIGVCGGSQGGGLAMVIAGLDKRVDFLTAYFPALCDQEAWLAKQADGWPHTFRLGMYGDSCLTEEVRNALSYFDVVNFASRIRVPGWYGIGYNDTVCPPTSVMAAYNGILAEKQIITFPGAGHWNYPKQEELRLKWIHNMIRNYKLKNDDYND